MDLFDMADHPEETAQPLGYRMQRLEVYNWGTFDEKVWTLDLSGETTLLTGDVGSGKSTLVDAIITLLVPPKKVTYNKAADSSAKERSLMSYVRGYYGQSRTEDGGGRPEALRGRDGYSVVLGVFSDRNFGRTVTLAQVFWFADEGAQTPKHFYVKADRTLTITEQFSDIGTDMRAFRKKLEQDRLTSTFDDYPPYAQEFRKTFGIRQVQAMDLFQQTVSMKKVDSLTDFVRQNMLEVPDMDREIELLLTQYHDLEQAHQAVVRAQDQMTALEPIEKQAGEYQRLQREKKDFQDMQRLVSAWFAERDYGWQQQKLQSQAKERDRQAERIADFAEQKKRKEQQRLEVHDASIRSGGGELESMKKRLDALQEKRARVASQRASYMRQAEVLGLPVPERAETFSQNGQRVTELQTELSEELDELNENIGVYSNNVRENKKRAEEIGKEISSLSQRKSNIPAKFIDLRGRLCKDLDLAEQEMPFAGELMEVREDESEWEGALERLLRGFGISLLVSDVHYPEVIRWMESHNLGMKLVYFRVPEQDAGQALDVDMPEGSACSKLNLKEDSPFYGWIASELSQRYNHICCEDVQDFRRQKFALSKQGQIKTNGRRHEKDDRHDIHDRRQYVLGFSNLRKIQSLRDELADTQEEEKFFQKQVRKAKDDQNTCQERQMAARLLAEVQHYSAIDEAACRAEVDQCRALVEDLQQKSDVLRKLQEKEAALVEDIMKLDDELHKATAERNRLDGACRQCQELLKNEEETFSAFSQEERDHAYPLLDKYASSALQSVNKDANMTHKRDAYADWVNNNINRMETKLRTIASSLSAWMSDFRSKWPETCADFVTSADGAEDYLALLNRLRRDDLPKFEGRFRELLKENTINQIALFRTHLETACRNIEERIGLINESLAAIDYNPGRFIRIEPTKASNEVVNKFKDDLRLCMDDTLTGDDDIYSEQKFKQVAEIVERLQGRPDHTELDARWRAQVTDVRNWYTFAASEKWRETGEEYEHYTDSGGKSGGQKEKLAYTILAASIVYNFGIEGRSAGEQSFRFVVIDEAFLKSSDESARFGLELFKKLDLQLLVVTPLLKLATIEPYVKHVGFVYLKDAEHRSYLRNLTIQEFQQEKAAFTAKEKEEPQGGEADG